MLNLLYGVISASYTVVAAPPPVTPPPPPTCTATCGSWSYTYGDWSGWSVCSGGTQSRTRTVTGTQTCTASNCSTYTNTSTSTESQSQSCSSGTTWYCTTNTGGHFTSDSDVSGGTPCVSYTSCSTTGYPSTPLVPC